MDPATAQLVVQHASEALFVLDPAGAIRACNPAAGRLLAVVHSQLHGQRLAELLGPEIAAMLGAGQAVARRELIVRRADGTRLCVDLSLTLLTGGGHVCALRDITAARVDQDRDTVQARYRGLFESLPDAIVIVNDCGLVVHVNAQAIRMFGLQPGEVIGSPIEMLLPPRLRAQHLPQRSAYLQAPGMRPMGRGLDLFGMRADGREFPVEISLSPIDLDGRRLVISAIRDISDRKAIERALQQKNLELEQANRAKDHFLATMSHELRTPLNAILGFTGLLLMRLPGPLTETQERQLNHVQSSGRHLLSLINDLLDLARIESGHVELQCETVDARPVIEDVLTSLRPNAEARGLVLDHSLPPGPLPVHADRRALQQVMLNLTGNAIKFTPHGRVQIAARAVGCPQGKAWWVVDVIDTGVGISGDDMARLFQAFVQVGDGRLAREEGTGLGLHLSRKLAELMGGRLEAHSVLGEGSTFTLTLPAMAA